MNKEYCEVVVEGSLDLIRGFVVGFLEGRGIRGEAVFGEEHHVENESKFGQMMRLIGVRGTRFRLIVGTGFLTLLKEALERRRDELALKIVSEKKISRASFGFRFRAYTRELGGELKALFGSPPDGLQVKDYQPKETVLPEGKGVEAYAPLHEYEVKATGTLSGPICGVIDFYGKAEHYDMVELGNIKLEYDKS
ncbi:MAG: hypothetical protein JXI32_02165 [Deltaproteobacteria bacterium]|nr:hypothetical protein [Deltaproteobacteria bacterium]